MRGQEDHGIEGLLLGGNGDLALKGKIVEVSGDGGRTGVLRGLLEFGQTKAGEAGVPMDVGLLGFIGQGSETGGAADFVTDA